MAKSLQSETDEACAAAQADAEEETSGALWFLAGCALTWVGVVGAYVIKPNPTATKLLGKSPEYVAAYTDCYKDKAVSIQTKWAWIGCGVSAVAYLIYVIAVVAAASSTTTS
jgi:hypothetical protein